MKLRKTIQDACVFLMLVAMLIASAGSLNYGFIKGEHIYTFTGVISIGVVIVSAIAYVLKRYNGER